MWHARRKKGDYLVENRMYVNAIHIYEDALRSVDTGGLGGQYEGEIYHNMAAPICISSRWMRQRPALKKHMKVFIPNWF